MSAGVPQNKPSFIHMGKNIRSPSMDPLADGRPTYEIQCGAVWFPEGQKSESSNTSQQKSEIPLKWNCYRNT
jgi:hypothetical protein